MRTLLPLPPSMEYRGTDSAENRFGFFFRFVSFLISLVENPSITGRLRWTRIKLWRFRHGQVRENERKKIVRRIVFSMIILFDREREQWQWQWQGGNRETANDTMQTTRCFYHYLSLCGIRIFFPYLCAVMGMAAPDNFQFRTNGSVRNERGENCKRTIDNFLPINYVAEDVALYY